MNQVKNEDREFWCIIFAFESKGAKNTINMTRVIICYFKIPATLVSNLLMRRYLSEKVENMFI